MTPLSFWNKRRKNAGDNASPSQADGQIAALFSTAGSYGIQTLAEPENASVDIVFVHSLTGNRQNTWTHNDGVFWPKDLLPKDLPTARIMTFGYDADVVGIVKTAGSNTLRDHGKSLANDLAMQRARSNSITRPLIFVAHGLGGLVVEQALLIARGAAQDHLKSLLESTFAMTFMGTPHMGSVKAEWARILSRLSSVLRQTNRNILSVLEPGSEVLANVQQEFHTMLDDRSRNQGSRIEIHCFYEEVAVLGIGEIVPRHSAILAAYSNTSIHGDHMSMTKFTGKNDPGYVNACDILWLWISEMEKKKDERIQDDSLGSAHAGYGPVYSGGGPVLIGSNSAGRDVTNIQLGANGRPRLRGRQMWLAETAYVNPGLEP